MLQVLFFYFSSKVLPRPPAEGSREAALRTYHGDADGVVELVHEDADDRRGQQQQDQRVFELHTERASQTFLRFAPRRRYAAHRVSKVMHDGSAPPSPLFPLMFTWSRCLGPSDLTICPFLPKRVMRLFYYLMVFIVSTSGKC